MALTFDHGAQTISTFQETVSAQELVDTCRVEEASVRGMAYPKILDAFGKVSLGVGVQSGVVAVLQDAWKIESLASSGSLAVSGGTVVQQSGGSIFKPNPLVQYENLKAVDGVGVVLKEFTAQAWLDHIGRVPMTTKVFTWEKDPEEDRVIPVSWVGLLAPGRSIASQECAIEKSDPDGATPALEFSLTISPDNLVSYVRVWNGVDDSRWILRLKGTDDGVPPEIFVQRVHVRVVKRGDV